MTKLFLELEHKGNKRTKRANSQQNLAVFSAGIDSENKIFKCYTEKDKTNIGQICHCLDRNLPLNIFARVSFHILSVSDSRMGPYDASDEHRYIED